MDSHKQIFYNISNIIEKYGVIDNNLLDKKTLCIIWNNCYYNTNDRIKNMMEIISLLGNFKVHMVVIYPTPKLYENIPLDMLYHILAESHGVDKNYTIENNAFQMFLHQNLHCEVIYIDTSHPFFDEAIESIKQISVSNKFSMILPYYTTPQQINNLSKMEISKVYYNDCNRDDYIRITMSTICNKAIQLFPIVINETEFDSVIMDTVTERDQINTSNMTQYDIMKYCSYIIDYTLKYTTDIDKIKQIYTNMREYSNKLDKTIKDNNKMINYFRYKLKQLMQWILQNYSVSVHNEKIKDIIQMIIDYSKKVNIKMNQHRHENLLYSRYISNLHLIKNLDIINKNVLKYVEDIDELDDTFEKSTEFYHSFFSLTNWFDELQAHCPIGLLTKISTTPLGKLGINCGIKYDNISGSFISIEDYLVTVLKYFDDNSMQTYGDLNNQAIIRENNQTTYNSVIPLYINKVHWECTKKFVPFILGISLSHSPLGFTNKHHLFFFSLLSQFTARIVYKNEYDNDRFIMTYMAYLRTCMEVCIDNGYNRGIYKLVKQYIEDPKKHVLPSIDAYQTLLGQMLCIRLKHIDDLDAMIEYMLEDVFRIALKQYNTKYLYDIFSHDEVDRKEYVYTELDKVMDYISTVIYEHIDILMSFYVMMDVMEDMYKTMGSYNKFLQFMEKNYSLVTSEHIEQIRSSIKEKKTVDRTLEKFYSIRNIAHTNSENYSQRKYFYIIQGIEQSQNKDRYDAIESGKYIDCNNHLMDINEMYAHYNKIYGKNM